MNLKTLGSAVLFASAVTALEFFVVATLKGPAEGPEPEPVTRSRVVVKAPPPAPLRPVPLPAPEAALQEDRSPSLPAPTPLVQPAALAELAPPAAGLSLKGALPGLTGDPGNPLAGMAEPDRPAVPRRSPSPRYPVEARRRGIEGFVVLRMRVDETGRVSSAVIVEAEPQGVFDRSARNAALAYRFTPARSGGHSVPSTLEQRMSFRLR